MIPLPVNVCVRVHVVSACAVADTSL